MMIFGALSVFSKSSLLHPMADGNRDAHARGVSRRTIDALRRRLIITLLCEKDIRDELLRVSIVLSSIDFASRLLRGGRTITNCPSDSNFPRMSCNTKM